MTLDLNWINLLILFGAIQGFIISIILFTNKKHPGAKFLGVFMLVLVYNGLETFNWSAGLDNYIIFFDLFAFVIIFGLGPSLYLYIYSLFFPEQQLSRSEILRHYIPLFFQLSFNFLLIVVYLLIVNDAIEFSFDPRILFVVYDFYSEPFSVLVFLYYLYLSVKLYYTLNKTRHRILTIPKSAQLLVYNWAKALLICMIALGVGWVLIIISPYLLDGETDVHYYFVEIPLVFFIYWIGFVGYHRTKTIYSQQDASTSVIISSDEASSVIEQLQRAMEQDKLYLDQALNRDKVASHIGVSAKQLSAVLNQHYKQSFNEFVNQYRVQEVANKLLSDQSKQMTISGIAFESGFNSQATFQRVFKSIKGLTPKEFLSQHAK